MTIEKARELKSLLDSYDYFLDLPGRIRKMHKDGKHDDITNILLDLAARNEIDIEMKIKNFEKCEQHNA